ncbi:MAG: pilus assembly protein TadG-related protein [Pirellulales bacterium]
MLRIIARSSSCRRTKNHPDGDVDSHKNSVRPRRRRRGNATLWLILVLPVLLILLAIVVEAGHLLLARQQLSNALDAASTAAVFRWQQNGGGDTSSARTAGVDFASYNPLAPNLPLVLQTNYGAANANQNDDLTGATADLIFGAATLAGANIAFDADVEPICLAGDLLIEAVGDFDASSMSANGYLRVTYSAPVAAPPCWVIESLEVDLQSGSDADALFDGSPPYGDSTINLLAPAQAFTPTFQPASNVAAPAPVLQLTFTANGNTAQDFDPGTMPTPDVYQILVRTTDLWDGVDAATNNDGDSFGKYGVVVRVTFRNLINLETASQDFTFVDDGVDDNYSAVQGPAIGSQYIFAVRAAAQETIPSVTQTLFGFGIGPFTVKAESIAVYDSSSTAPVVRRVNATAYNPPIIATSP